MLPGNCNHTEGNSLRDFWLPRYPLRSRGPSPSDGLPLHNQCPPPTFPPICASRSWPMTSCNILTDSIFNSFAQVNSPIPGITF